MEEPQVTHQPVSHRRTYLVVFLLLTVMTALEVVLATTLPEATRAPFLLAMSFIKAMAVILYFMHLRSDSPWYRLIFAFPFIFVLAIFAVIRQ